MRFYSSISVKVMFALILASFICPLWSYRIPHYNRHRCLEQTSLCNSYGAACCGEMQCMSVVTKSLCIFPLFTNECVCMFPDKTYDNPFS
ncbi:unnamed protein product [Brachionus calyciflorus]|uniref:Uncharacterized protein n=1 Tax=Brachionus calyciflorus TaxID=104777 RepID=A0A813LY46_9BILA|nr:unnamed protein product [Brachionus calyciflorus]